MENPKQYSDSEIWSRLMARDEACIKWVMRRFGGGLISYLKKILGNWQDAEEVFSEALQVAILKARSYDPDRAKFSTWLYRIARNKAIDFLRQKKGNLFFELLNKKNEKQIFCEDSDGHHDENLQSTSLLVLFRYSLRQLSQEDQDLLRFKYVLNWSHKEIANQFRITDVNSRAKLRRAVQQLKTIMDGVRMKGDEKI